MSKVLSFSRSNTKTKLDNSQNPKKKNKLMSANKFTYIVQGKGDQSLSGGASIIVKIGGGIFDE